MSTATFDWTFKMSDGTTKTVSSQIEDLIFSGDDVSQCLINILDTNNERFSAIVPLTYFLGKLYSDETISANAGTLTSDLAKNSKTNFQKYYTGDISSITNSQWINLLSNGIINVLPNVSGKIDTFTGYTGKFTFIVKGGNLGDLFSITIPLIQNDGTILNTNFNLTNGDTLTIIGTEYNNAYGYSIISKEIATENTSNIVALGDLSKSGNTLNLDIPNIGVRFAFSGKGGGVYTLTVKPIGSDPITNLDLRRFSIWNGGSVETYTMDNYTLPVAGVNIDTSIYGASQDFSTVLVCVNGIVWKVYYWGSASASRVRTMAERTFV